MEQTNSQAKSQIEKINRQRKVAFILRLTTSVLLFLVIYAQIIKFSIMMDVYNEINPLNKLSTMMYLRRELSTIIMYIIFFVIDIFLLICAFIGKNRKWANVISIIFGFMTATIVFIGVFAIVGGFMGNANINDAQIEKAGISK